ncbi:cell division protein ZapE [Rhodovulum imhoffii]|uniref:Cell division protein ZapE n=1 Tax=Rhodovulum imhoffii TaxID=365340 RepID=A0A2T5BU58_9RHOB|nr:cell division protein ZapE [Rhodovulum imhoffii]MBK5932769.1 cell division protein ZapE [Rhodovulum imhoffii]PTN02976.1 cell division protein ZapE [Rhodovulum imhoffii]
MTLRDVYQSRVEAGDLYADPAQVAALSALERIRLALESPSSAPRRGLFRKAKTPDRVRGLYLWGGVGRGKSMLMDLFFDTVQVTGKRRVHFHAFMQDVHSGLHAARKSGKDDALAPVATDIATDLRLLCFDEMQITDITDAMIVGRLFQLLFEAGVTVVTTSNRVPDDLYKNGLQRERFLPFIALLKEWLEVQHLASATDYRQNRLSGADVYFTPADRLARAAIDEIWRDFAGEGRAPLILKVKGRAVELPFFCNGVARATFWDLCAQPLGPADYLAIAKAVRVLILEEIPRLSSENFNEARRFVTLIDALYEARVRLIVSAAAEPEMLYMEGEGAFEFERTASRLREMQGADWAAET